MLTAEQALAETISMGPIRAAAIRVEADQLLAKIEKEIVHAIECEQTKTMVGIDCNPYSTGFSDEAIDMVELDLLDLGYHIDHLYSNINYGFGVVETVFSHIEVSWGYN